MNKEINSLLARTGVIKSYGISDSVGVIESNYAKRVYFHKDALQFEKNSQDTLENILPVGTEVCFHASSFLENEMRIYIASAVWAKDKPLKNEGGSVTEPQSEDDTGNKLETCLKEDNTLVKSKVDHSSVSESVENCFSKNDIPVVNEELRLASVDIKDFALLKEIKVKYITIKARAKIAEYLTDDLAVARIRSFGIHHFTFLPRSVLKDFTESSVPLRLFLPVNKCSLDLQVEVMCHRTLRFFRVLEVINYDLAPICVTTDELKRNKFSTRYYRNIKGVILGYVSEDEGIVRLVIQGVSCMTSFHKNVVKLFKNEDNFVLQRKFPIRKKVLMDVIVCFSGEEVRIKLLELWGLRKKNRKGGKRGFIETFPSPVVAEGVVLKVEPRFLTAVVTDSDKNQQLVTVYNNSFWNFNKVLNENDDLTLFVSDNDRITLFMKDISIRPSDPLWEIRNARKIGKFQDFCETDTVLSGVVRSVLKDTVVIKEKKFSGTLAFKNYQIVLFGLLLQKQNLESLFTQGQTLNFCIDKRTKRMCIGEDMFLENCGQLRTDLEEYCKERNLEQHVQENLMADFDDWANTLYEKAQGKCLAEIVNCSKSSSSSGSSAGEYFLQFIRKKESISKCSGECGTVKSDVDRSQSLQDVPHILRPELIKLIKSCFNEQVTEYESRGFNVNIDIDEFITSVQDDLRSFLFDDLLKDEPLQCTLPFNNTQLQIGSCSFAEDNIQGLTSFCERKRLSTSLPNQLIGDLERVSVREESPSRNLVSDNESNAGLVRQVQNTSLQQHSSESVMLEAENASLQNREENISFLPIQSDHFAVDGNKFIAQETVVSDTYNRAVACDNIDIFHSDFRQMLMSILIEKFSQTESDKPTSYRVNEIARYLNSKMQSLIFSKLEQTLLSILCKRFSSGHVVENRNSTDAAGFITNNIPNEGVVLVRNFIDTLKHTIENSSQMSLDNSLMLGNEQPSASNLPKDEME